MLLNLGLTADAAAAHESDIAGFQKDSNDSKLSPPTRQSSPSLISFATLPSLGLSNLYHRHKGAESDIRHPGPNRAMSISPAASVASSDGEYSTAGPVLARPPISRSQSVRKQSSRPKTCYHLAQPAGHARHKRLKLRPKLLVQLQRVSSTARPQPILDVLPSTVFLPRLARKFPTIFRGKKGLGPNDLIIVTSDLYERSRGDIARQYLSSKEEHGEHQEVVATICQLLTEDALSKGKTEICLNYGPVWEATPLPNGSYEFVANTEEHGLQTLRWVQRGAKNRRVSAPPGSPVTEDTKRFTFSVVDPNTRRHPVIATMTRNCLEVFDEYSMPSPSSSNAPHSSAMSMISDGSEMDAHTDRKAITTDDNLRTLIIITSIWVAFREGWSHNFSYDDTALALNSKTLCSPIASRHHSPTAIKNETEHMTPVDEDEPDQPPRSPSKRPLSTSTAMPRNTQTPDRFMGYGSLSRRSNSTGAAFIERSNRRVSARRATSPSFHTQSDNENHGTNRAGEKISKNGLSSSQVPDRLPDKDRNGPHQLETSHEKDNKAFGGNEGSVPTKGKRRHRLSNLFDFITKRNGHR